MANQANLEATLAAIEANPDHWNQTAWHCGTSHCFAGFAEMLRLQMNPTDEMPKGHGCLVDSLATRDWLELTRSQWEWACSPMNTLDELRRVVKEGVPDEPDDDYDYDDDYDLYDDYDDDLDEDDWDSETA